VFCFGPGVLLGHGYDDTGELSDGDQREFDLETRVTTNENRTISEMFHSCALNK